MSNSSLKFSGGAYDAKVVKELRVPKCLVLNCYPPIVLICDKMTCRLADGVVLS